MLYFFFSTICVAFKQFSPIAWTPFMEYTHSHTHTYIYINTSIYTDAVLRIDDSLQILVISDKNAHKNLFCRLYIGWFAGCTIHHTRTHTNQMNVDADVSLLSYVSHFALKIVSFTIFNMFPSMEHHNFSVSIQ